MQQSLLKEVDNPQRYGVAQLDGDGTVQQVVEKPTDPLTNLAIVGVYAFTPAIFDAIDVIEPSSRGEYEITDAIQQLVNSGHQVTGQILEGFWEDAGNPEALLRANRLYLDRIEAHTARTPNTQTSTVNGAPVYIGPDTVMENVTLNGPCFIGEECELEDSVIGPNVSIRAGCRISDSKIKNSILGKNSQVTNIKAGLHGSILGQDVVVTGPGERPSPACFTLGDMAQVQFS